MILVGNFVEGNELSVKLLKSCSAHESKFGFFSGLNRYMSRYKITIDRFFEKTDLVSTYFMNESQPSSRVGMYILDDCNNEDSARRMIRTLKNLNDNTLNIVSICKDRFSSFEKWV
jgi:hypothetical protein